MVADTAEKAIFRQTLLDLQGAKESTQDCVREMVEREPVQAVKLLQVIQQISSVQKYIRLAFIKDMEVAKRYFLFC